MGTNRDFVAVQGDVSTTIKLPDGRQISENFHLVYIDRDQDGIYRVRANSRGWLKIDKALSKLHHELDSWGADVLTPDELKEREIGVSTWLTAWNERLSNSEGFQVARKGYRFAFSYSTFEGPWKEVDYFYEILLREPTRR